MTEIGKITSKQYLDLLAVGLPAYSSDYDTGSSSSDFSSEITNSLLCSYKQENERNSAKRYANIFKHFYTLVEESDEDN